MNFKDFWEEVAKTDILPNTAIREIPDVLSVETKKRLMKENPYKVGNILSQAIDQINHGSLKSIETLLKEIV